MADSPPRKKNRQSQYSRPKQGRLQWWGRTGGGARDVPVAGLYVVLIMVLAGAILLPVLSHADESVAAGVSSSTTTITSIITAPSTPTTAADKTNVSIQDVFDGAHAENTIVQTSSHNDDDDDDVYEFGGSISLGKKVFSWTDKVHITIISHDHNFNRNAIDTIGDTEHDSVKITTRKSTLKEYRLTETGPNTGVFTGEVTLIGFDHNADGDTRTGSGSRGYDNPQRAPGGSGPSGGYLAADRNDAITVAFEYTDGHTAVGTALIRWSEPQIEWLESIYSISGTGTVRVVDPDMNFNPESLDRFEVHVWSDSDPVGVSLAVTESDEASGIFEGSLTFSMDDTSSGHRLRVAEGDLITASYTDSTLPAPYNTGDTRDFTATSQMGLSVSPLERVRASDINIKDALDMDVGNEISAGQQVQVMTHLTNTQEQRSQSFVYIVMVKDKDIGVAVSISWIMGSLQAKQTLNAATSWLPSEAGVYEIETFVWESIVRPNALAPPSKTTVTVN